MSWTVVCHLGAGWRAVRDRAATDGDVTLYTDSFESAYDDGVEAFGEEEFKPEFPQGVALRGGKFLERLNVGQAASLEKAGLIRYAGGWVLTAKGRDAL